jgi:hypothetical protein
VRQPAASFSYRALRIAGWECVEMGQVAATTAPCPVKNAGCAPRFWGTRFEEVRLKNGDSEFIIYLDGPKGITMEVCVITMPTEATRMREFFCIRKDCTRRALPLTD